MWYIVRLDSSRVANLDKVRSVTLVSSDDSSQVELYTSKNYDFTANRTLPRMLLNHMNDGICRHLLITSLHLYN